MDSLLDSSAVDSNEPPALSRNSPKDSNTPCSKDFKSSKEHSSSLKDSCSGEKQMQKCMAPSLKAAFLFELYAYR